MGEPPFAGPPPRGRHGKIPPFQPLPIAGSVELEMPVDRMWQSFLDVSSWPRWNRSVWRSAVRGGELCCGARLAFAFNPIERRYLYKLPAMAKVVEFEPHDRVTWEVNLPGFHALHAYRFAAVGEERCRFGSWEAAEGAAYRGTGRFWLAHFRFVCRESLRGAQALAEQGGP